jgi:hypothetical protein
MTENSPPDSGSDATKADPKLASPMDLNEGDTDPALNKTIKTLILATHFFIVFVATDLSIQWRTTNGYVAPEHLGDVLNKVAVLEVRSQFISDPVALGNIRRQIAESLARCLDGQSIKSSWTALKEVEIEIGKRNKETSWSWYFSTAYKLTLACAVTLAIMWFFRVWVRGVLGHTAFDVVLGALCGAVGALLSVTTRGDRLVMDANAGRKLHQLEGVSRIGAGVGGALFAGLAIKSGLILGGAHLAGNPLALILACSIAAGASERLVPSLVKTFEHAMAPTGERERKMEKAVEASGKTSSVKNKVS